MDLPASPLQRTEVFGRKGQIPVCATINGFTFRNSLMPRAGVHILGAGKDALAAAGTATGDTVKVEIVFDDAPRIVELPDDFQAVLADAPEQADAFAALSFSHKKEYGDWIESAKKAETRHNLVEKGIVMLAAKKMPKG